MLQLAPQMRIYVALEPADFRSGIDGLARRCRAVLQLDPQSGAIFLFRNRSGTSIKAICYDGQGFWLAQKRLSAGRFADWPSSSSCEVTVTLTSLQAQALLWNGDPMAIRTAPIWRPLAV